MKRLIKKSLYKIFVSLFVLFYSFVPQSIAIGQVIEEYSQGSAAPIEEVIIPEESLLVEEEVVLPEEEIPPVVEEPLVEEPIIEEPIVEEPIVQEPVVEPEEIIKEVMSYPVWVINGNTATTYDVAQLGKTYIAPQNSRVRIIFTKLPENPSTISIEEITLTQEEIEATGAVSDKAYDIKTDMIDGTFEYDLVLPSIEEETKVVYVEEREDIFTDIKEITNEVVNEGDSVKVEDIDHFTIFIVTGIWPTTSDNGLVSGEGTSQIRWPQGESNQSGLGFVGETDLNLESLTSSGQAFILGTLTHYNHPVSSAIIWADLKITLDLPTDKDFTFRVQIDETPNLSSGCTSGFQITTTPCDDKITFPNSISDQIITVGGIDYTLIIDGFRRTVGGPTLNSFVTEERKDNAAFLVGHFVPIGHIVVDKVTIPTGDSTSFPFSTTGAGYDGFTLKDSDAPNDQVLPAGVTYTVSEVVPSGWNQVSAVCTSSIINEVETVSALELDPGETIICTFTNTKDITDISIAKTDSPDPVNNGGTLTYTLTVNNLTTVPAANVIVSDTLPSEFSITSVTPSVGACSDIVGPDIKCELGTLAGNTSATVTIVGMVSTSSSSITNNSSVTTDTPETSTINNNYSEDTTVNQNGQIKGYKWIDVDGDGIKETGEDVPNSQWQIKLWKEVNGVPVDQGISVSTDPATGAFSFGVMPGTYYLSEVLPTTGWTQTQPSAGSLLAPDRVTRLIGPIVVTSGSISEGNNFGNFKNVSITVCKWKDLDGDILTEDQTAISGWSISLIKDDDTENINTKSTEANGCAQWLDMGPGSYKVTEKYQTGWTNLTPTTHDFGTVQSGSENFFKFINTQQPITIKAYKIVCTDESQLPNWGTGGPNITANTAQDWVNSHNTCSFVDNWNFQWGNQTASNPGDNTGETSVSTWHKFGPTVNGLATVEIPATEIEGFNSIWMREAWNSNYIPFTYNIVGGNSNDVTAEIYCHTDVLNYDNLDRIDNIQNGDTYYCVAWNVVANPGIEVEKSGPDYAINGENITYKYEVTNKGNVPLTTISVTDDKCTPVQYKSGDDGDSLLENGETWKYECTTTIPWTFPTAFTNKAEAKGYYFDRELKDDDEFTLYPFTLRKDVLLYWDGDTIQYSDPNTGFNVDIKNGDTILGTKTISESSPLNLWLSDGTYHFCEKDLPLGYIQGYDGCINYTTGQGYPDWSQINVITFDLAIDKIAPSVAYKGETITYEYKVTNSGPASVTPVVEDKLCPPIYVSGDADIDGKVDPSETWKYTCDYVVTESGGATITNTATVHDQEGEGWDYTGWYLGGDINLVNNTDTENTPVRAGSIRVCKLVLTPDGQITNGSEVPGFNFSITGLNVTTSQGAPAGVLPQTSYSTPLTLNTNLYSSYSGNDVYCKTYDDLSIGHFYYGEESYENPWNEPKYNDSDLNWSNAISYSGELFDADSTNDGQRNTVGDGDILLTKSRLDRTLLVVNQYPYSSIQGRKYYDVNINGNFDSDEKKDSNRLNGWAINLYDNQWNLKQSMVTGNDNTPAGDVSKGQFRFENVLAGTYYVCEEPQTGWYQTEPSSGIQHNGLYCHTVNLGYAEDKTEIQFGNYQGSDVNICKKDNYNRSLSGWDIVLASEKVQSAKSINVSNSSGTSSSSLPAGIYLIKVSGTYRYGNTQMIADAGFSYRPLGIPYGTGGWVSGLDLSSKGLMAWVNGSSVNWGAYDSGHVYTYVYEHNGGPVNISIYDDNYGDNVNSNFTFEIFKVNTWAKGTTERNGCVTLKAVPYGQYILDEYLKDGWVDISGKGLEVTINDISENFTIKNRIDAPVTIKATKIVCDYEEDLPNWGAIKSDGNPITQGRIDQFLSDKEGKCRVVPDWEFEWAYEGAGNPGDEVIGYGGGNWNTFGSSVQIDNLLGGRLELREVLQENYIPFTYGEYGNNSNNESAEFYCYNDVMNYDNWEWLNTPEYGQTYYCVGFNTLTRTDVYGYKWNDINRDGERNCIQEEPSNILEQVRGILFNEGQSECEEDDLEPLLSDWRIFIDENENGIWEDGEQEMLTDGNDHLGWYWFEDLLLGEYRICEEIPSNWAQTYPGEPIDPQCHTISLPNDCNRIETRVATPNAVETYCEFNFGNIEESELYISETNNSWPNTLQIGDTFTYTITVRALKGPVTGVTLINLPPQGFVPQSGTFSAESDIHGSLDTSGVVYASPGLWDLGDMVKDEVITITYTALVTANVDAGEYPDLTFARGTGVRGLTILALSEESDFEINKGIVDQHFVGTQVRIGEELEIEEGEVLGAAITLPRTGADTYITLGALISMILGFILLVFNPKKRIKNLFIAGVVLFSMFFILKPLPTYASVADIDVRIEQPVTPTNKNTFKIGFVALDLQNRTVTVECYKDGILFGTYATNSGNCEVTPALVTTSGTYDFYVKAKAGGDENISSTVSVEVVLEKPLPVINYAKTEGTCKYTLSFKTANDGRTSKVEIFRSSTQPFTANASTLIHTETVGPNTPVTYTDSSITDCTKEYYYAMRSLDDYNNVSTLVTDDIVTIVRTPAPVNPTPVEVTEDEGEVAGEETTPEENKEEENGEIKGEEDIDTENGEEEGDDKDNENNLKSIWSDYKYFIIAVLVVALGSGAYTYVRRKR